MQRPEIRKSTHEKNEENRDRGNRDREEVGKQEERKETIQLSRRERLITTVNTPRCP